MNINCKKHKKIIKYICVVQGCKSGNMVCEECLMVDPIHANQHRNFLFSTQDFVKIQNSNAYKHFLPHISHTLTQCETKINENIKQAEQHIKQLNDDFQMFERIYKQLAFNAKSYLSDKLTSNSKKYENKLLELKDCLKSLNQDRQKETSFFGMFFSSEEKPPDCQSQIMALIKKNWNLNRVRSEAITLKNELEKQSKPKPIYKQSQNSNKIIQQATQKMRTQLKNIFRSLKPLIEDQQSIEKMSSSVFRQRKPIFQNNNLSSSRSSLSKSMINVCPNLPTCKLPQCKLQNSLPPLDMPPCSMQGLIQLGPFKYPDQSIYFGSYKNQKRWGRGIIYYNDGAFYEGYWKDDLPNGYGRIARSDGTIYEGEIMNGKAEGKGWLSKGPLRYNGDWKNDMKQGNGQEVLGIKPGGYQYKGQFKENKFNGYGNLFNQNLTYNGQFQKGVCHGNGTVILIYQIIYNNSQKYTGQFKKGFKQGKGTYQWPDGNRYQGQFHNNIPHGYGVFFWIDGQIFKGNWLNGEQHGTGIQISNDGMQKRGEWQNGQWIKWI